MKSIMFAIFLLIAIAGGAIWLQVYLARCKGKWLGLILPAITLLISLSMVLSITANGMTNGELFVFIATTLLMGNIPTIVLLGIYFACREKMRLKAQLARMKIQDLD